MRSTPGQQDVSRRDVYNFWTLPLREGDKCFPSVSPPPSTGIWARQWELEKAWGTRDGSHALLPTSWLHMREMNAFVVYNFAKLGLCHMTLNRNLCYGDLQCGTWDGGSCLVLLCQSAGQGPCRYNLSGSWDPTLWNLGPSFATVPSKPRLAPNFSFVFFGCGWQLWRYTLRGHSYSALLGLKFESMTR